jgi:hypothetical protein
MIEKVVLADGIKEIGVGAFAGCTAISEIAIPEGVTTIGEMAFANCESLVKVGLPSTIKTIGECAFKNCGALATVDYNGTEANKAEIVIDYENEDLEEATWNFKAVHEHVAGEWEVVTAATNASNGLMVKKCACGEVMEEKVIPAILKFKGASLELQSNLSIIYTVDKTFFTTFGYTKPYVVFQLGAVTEVVTEYTLRSSDGAYQFKFSGIAPQFMNDNIVATLYAENNGETYTAVHNTYSVVAYCKSQLGKTTSSATFKTFLVDTLKYGSAAQVYAKHNTTKLAIDELTADQKALGTTEEIAVTDYLNLNSTVIENATSNFKSASLFLEDSITVRYSFELINGQTIDGVKFFVNVPSIGKSWTLTEEDFTYDTVKKRYYVDFSELNPSQMRDIIHTTVMKDGAAISNTIAYSIESYVARDKGGDANLTAMLKAMMQFGVAAEKYAGK